MNHHRSVEAIVRSAPEPEDLWLTDADGRRYACELKMCALAPLIL